MVKRSMKSGGAFGIWRGKRAATWTYLTLPCLQAATQPTGSAVVCYLSSPPLSSTIHSIPLHTLTITTTQVQHQQPGIVAAKTRQEERIASVSSPSCVISCTRTHTRHTHTNISTVTHYGIRTKKNTLSPHDPAKSQRSLNGLNSELYLPGEPPSNNKPALTPILELLPRSLTTSHPAPSTSTSTNTSTNHWPCSGSKVS